VNNATDTAWGQRLLHHSSAACFPSGRIKFHDANGSPTGAPLQGQMILHLESLHERMEREMSERSDEHQTPSWFDLEFSPFGAVFQR